MTTPQLIVLRPIYASVSLPRALAWHWRGWHLSEKMDGVWAVRELCGCVVTGETMPDGRFFAFDVPIAFGDDLRRRPWTDRRAALDHLFARLTNRFNWHRCTSGAGSEFIEAVLARGGEGVVAKPFVAPFGVDLVKVKRCETFDCLVTEKHPAKQSLHLSLNGEDVGWCACLGKNFDLVRPGELVEIVAYGRHASGKFREPRFVRVRHDKVGVA